MKIKRLIDFAEIKNFVVKRRGCTIDGLVFRLHYRATVIILVGFCLMVTAKQFFGQPMECISDFATGEGKDQNAKILNRYCFISTTFSVNTAWRKEVGEEVPYPGVDNVHGGKGGLKKEGKSGEDQSTKNTSEVTYHAYYQWVCFVLLLQAVIFYLPHVFWKRCEGSLTRRLLNGLDQYVMSKEERREKVDSVAEYLLATSGRHSYLVVAYSTATALNLLNIVGQLVLVDRFLGSQFANYGLEVLGWQDWSEPSFPLQYDPMMQVFPRMTKCTFHNYGPSGDMQKYDAICVLSINIVNEKGYLFLWFWFYLLLVLTLVSLLHSLLLLLFPFLRLITLHSTGKKMVAKRDVHRVLTYTGGGQVGDFFLLHLLSKNMTTGNFGELMHRMAARIAQKEKMH